jgi:hypothetical protein
MILVSKVMFLKTFLQLHPIKRKLFNECPVQNILADAVFQSSTRDFPTKRTI